MKRRSEIPDPFADPECSTCVEGWVLVHPNYALGMVPGDLDKIEQQLHARQTLVNAGGTDDTLAAEWHALEQARYLREVWATAVFPCPSCRRVQYDRWRNGCYARNHRRASCELCGPKDKRSAA